MKLFGWKFYDNDETSWEEFHRIKWLLIEITALSLAVSALSVLIIWQQWFYPYHVRIGLALYILSYIPFIYKIYATRLTWMEYSTYDYAYKFLKRQKYIFITMSVLIFVIFAYLLSDYITFI